MQHQARTRRGAVALLLILAMLSVMVVAIVPFVSSAEPAEFYGFGYQTPSDYDMLDSGTTLRFVFQVPASKIAGYTDAGFVFSKTDSTPTVEEEGSGCAIYHATSVYGSITADGKTVDAEENGYWIAVKMTNIPASYFDGAIYVNAFVTDGEGTRYSGAKKISVWGANAIEIVSDWDESTRTAYNTANGVDWLNHDDNASGIHIKLNINSIKSASQHYYPDVSNDYEGNDLLVEVSFLWNSTLETKYTWQQFTFAHVDAWDLVNVGSVITPKERAGYTYDFLYPTEGSHTPSLGEYGWHRLGFRVHQDAEIVDAAVQYTYVASVYVDGELKVSFDATDYVVRRNPTGTVTALLYTAEIEGGKLVYYDIGSDPKSTYKTSYGVLTFEEFFTKAGGYCVLSDLSMTCGQTFVQQVKSVADPAAKEYLPTDGSAAITAKVYYTTADPHEHVWDGNYVVTKPATLIEDGLKVEHCSVCGEARTVAASGYAPIIISSSLNSSERAAFNTANGVDWLQGDNIMIKKNINDVKDNSQHYYPDASNNYEGNDLLVEVSFLWNSTLATKYTWQQFTFAHVDGWDLVNVGSVITPKERAGYTYDFLYPTEGSHTPSLGEYGWHRLGFRVHQEADIVNDAVKYTYVASVYVDGELKVSFDATDYVVRRNPTGTVTALLYTANIEDDHLVYYDIRKNANPSSTYQTSYAVLMFEEFFTKTGAFCVLGDLYMTCGHDFVQQVAPVATPAAASINLGGNDYSAAFYYRLAD